MFTTNISCDTSNWPCWGPAGTSRVILTGLCLSALIATNAVRVDELNTDEPRQEQTVKESIAAEAKKVELHVGEATIELLRIPPGEFEFGAPPTEEGYESHEGLPRKVRITKPFYLGKYEITQAQYRAVTGESRGSMRGDTVPVNEIFYGDAAAYCENLCARGGESHAADRGPVGVCLPGRDADTLLLGRPGRGPGESRLVFRITRGGNRIRWAKRLRMRLGYTICTGT